MIDDHIDHIDNCLKPLVNFIKQKRISCGSKNFKFNHDHARPHVHKSVITYLNELNFTIMNSSNFSPDLAPSDICQRIDDHSSAQSPVRQITRLVNSLPKEEFSKTFQKLKERMQLYIKYQGDYLNI